jgi:hypothetical protein
MQYLLQIQQQSLCGIPHSSKESQLGNIWERLKLISRGKEKI